MKRDLHSKRTCYKWKNCWQWDLRLYTKCMKECYIFYGNLKKKWQISLQRIVSPLKCRFAPIYHIQKVECVVLNVNAFLFVRFTASLVNTCGAHFFIVELIMLSHIPCLVLRVKKPCIPRQAMGSTC